MDGWMGWKRQIWRRSGWKDGTAARKMSGNEWVTKWSGRLNGEAQ